MNDKPTILSREEMLIKYHESNIEGRLNTYECIVEEKPQFNRVTETYKDRLSRSKVLVRHFLKNGDKTEMTVTFLFHDGKRYVADRIS